MIKEIRFFFKDKYVAKNKPTRSNITRPPSVVHCYVPGYLTRPFNVNVFFNVTGTLFFSLQSVYICHDMGNAITLPCTNEWNSLCDISSTSVELHVLVISLPFTY